MLALVTGGSGSGKSAYAEQLVLEQGDLKRYYIATMYPWDQECLKKIENHRKMRQEKQFQTIECYQDLHKLVLEPDSVVLLECLSNLTANEFYREDCDRSQVTSHILNGIMHLQKQVKTLIIVTNEVFSDGEPYNQETQRYQKILGDINRELAKVSDRVTEVVYGIPVAVK